MKIAVIGIRGIPVIYSGFESFAENLSTDLAKKGYDMTVYCRHPYVDRNTKIYKKVKLVTLPTLRSKNFESIIHGFFSTIHACFFLQPKVIYYLGVGNSPFTFFPRLFGIKTIINVDGLDWRREKWGIFAKMFLLLSQYLSTIFPDVTITDSLFMKDYYKEKYHKNTIYIPYGFDKKLLKLGKNSEDKTLFEYGLKKRKYFVWVGRIVPDNHLEELIYAFKKLKTDNKCVVIGDDVFTSSYKKFIFDLSANDKRIMFTGFLEKEKYAQLVRNSFCYVETKRSGGTHPSLIEAMGLGCLIVSNDHSSNKHILNNNAIIYNVKRNDLIQMLKFVISNKFKSKISPYKIENKQIISRYYNFQTILKQYLQLFTCRE